MSINHRDGIPGTKTGKQKAIRTVPLVPSIPNTVDLLRHLIID
jgi:hypothetical protein